MSSDVKSALSQVRQRISEAAQRAGRNPAEITIMAVTKTHPAESVLEALDAGVTVLGENRVQEAVQKYAHVRQQRPDQQFELHLIGHLQRNKAKLVCGTFGWVDSLDKLSTATALSTRLQEAGAGVSVMVEYNSSRETAKSGFWDRAELVDAAAQIDALPGLQVAGLMTIGPLTDDDAAVATAFAQTRRVWEDLTKHLPGASILSMGMSDDYEIAVREGATLVRLGTVLFGRRPQ